jgi:Sulfotransferase family
VAPGLLAAARTLLATLSAEDIEAVLRAPVIIVAAPRSGSSLLFEQLSRIDGFWSIGGESHGIFRAFPHLRAADPQLTSGRLDETHADAATCDLVRACFLVLLRDHRNMPYGQLRPERRPRRLTLLEKTPRNALNVPFLRHVFPAARFVYLHRDPRQSIASIAEAWTVGLASGRFVTFRDLPGWDRAAWCLVLPPEWRQMRGRTLVEIAAFQWAACNNTILDDLEHVERQHWMPVSYEELVESPYRTVERICRFAGIEPAEYLCCPGALPLSRTTVSPPHADKWKRAQAEIEALLPSLEATAKRIRDAGSAS